MSSSNIIEEQRTIAELTAKVNEIVAPYGLTAEIPLGINSVGVGGDERTYTPIVILIGEFPGYDVLDQLKSEICNTLPINRVTFQLAVKAKNKTD